MNLFTSKTNTRDLEDQMVSIHRIANTLSYRNDAPIYGHPHKMSLSGTPLNEALVALNQILPKFQQENKLQKVQCVVLTDGEAPPLKFHKEFHNRLMNDGQPYVGLNNVGSDVFFVIVKPVVLISLLTNITSLLMFFYKISVINLLMLTLLV